MDLLERLNSLPYYKQNYPKSLGVEWVNNNILPILDSYGISLVDKMRTFVEHISFQIGKSLSLKEKQSVLLTGGGTFNLFLIELIQSKTNVKLIIPDKLIINYKEALIFAYLGYLKIEGKINCLKSVTGAKSDSISGILIN